MVVREPAESLKGSTRGNPFPSLRLTYISAHRRIRL